MEQKLPRLVIAGTNSGCGKTTVTCAVLQALVNRGLSVAAAKCGPDYIDPMFHSRIIGAKSANLDPFFFDEATLRYLLAQNAAGCAVTIIEGVMGYYDGLGLTTTRASNWETAQKTASPTILVVNARGAALSVLAAVQGFLQFQPQSGIRGVILNGCTVMSYAPLAKELEARFGIQACGYLPRLPACTLESRHLGLVTAAEVADLREKLQRLAAQAETSIDLDLLLRLANEAPPLAVCPPPLPEAGESVRIGVARDRAFCFYYEDSLALLSSLGGSRCGTARTICNLLLVWLLTGIWHGAAATFVVWGLYYGLLLILEKFVLRDVLARVPAILRRVLTFLLVVIGWVPFFSDTLGQAGAWLARMFSAGQAGFVDAAALYYLRTTWPVLLIAVFAALPYGCRFGNRFFRAGRTASMVSSLYFIGLLLLCIAGMVNGTYVSFLYAQF